MVGMEQIQRGATQYIDREVLPKMQGKDKWIVAGISTMLLSKLPAILNNLAENDMVKILDIFSEDGKVDVESVISAVRPAMRSTPAVIQIPMGGQIKLTEADIDMLYQYIIQS